MAQNEHAVELFEGDWIPGSPIIVVCPNCHVQDYYPRMRYASTYRACDTCGENSPVSEWKVSPKAEPEDQRANEVASYAIDTEDYLPSLSFSRLGTTNETKINRVQLLGSLTDNPEMRFTSSGEGVLSFTLDIEGEATNIFPINAWGDLAKLGQKQLKKGSRIYLEGRLLINNKTVVETTYLNGDDEYEVGVDRYNVTIVAKKIEFLDNQQLNKPESETMQTIKQLLLYLKLDREIIFKVINELKSLDLENID